MQDKLETYASRDIALSVHDRQVLTTSVLKESLASPSVAGTNSTGNSSNAVNQTLVIPITTGSGCTNANAVHDEIEFVGPIGGSSNNKSVFKTKLASGSGGSSSGSKVKASHKIKAQTSRIVSSFKTQSVVSSVVREFCGHKDGVWQIAAKAGQNIIGTASADHTACIWNIESGRPLLQYTGHGGSVNSIKFHPQRDLILTGSGDGTAHIWQAAVNLETNKCALTKSEKYTFIVD